MKHTFEFRFADYHLAVLEALRYELAKMYDDEVDLSFRVYYSDFMNCYVSFYVIEKESKDFIASWSYDFEPVRWAGDTMEMPTDLGCYSLRKIK